MISLSWDELKVAARLEQRRSEQLLFKGTSFQTISAYGAHGAIIHYKVFRSFFLFLNLTLSSRQMRQTFNLARTHSSSWIVVDR